MRASSFASPMFTARKLPRGSFTVSATAVLLNRDEASSTTVA